jgi:thiamine biosynthesis lipoprotein
MDSKRGAPLVDAPASVTVLSASCMMADAMATALMVMGGKTGAEFASAQGISALFLLRGTGGFLTVGTGVFAVEP